MFRNKHLLCLFKLYKYKVKCSVPHCNVTQIRTISATLNLACKEEETQIALRRNFEETELKTKRTYMDMVHLFAEKDNVHRRGHVEFIYSALKNMESFGVHKDLEVYKAILDVLPKGRFIPTNILQSEFMHYPKQQQCAIDLLEQMEDNGVMPDTDMEDMLLNIFGKRGYPLRKYWRMMYWMPKFKNLSPWPVPNPPPQESYELAKLAIERITSVDLKREVTTFDTTAVPSSVDHTWIVSAQSPTQRRLLGKHDKSEPIYIEGAYRVWLRNQPVNYFVMRANAKPPEPVVEPDSDDVSNIKVPLFSIPPSKSVILAKYPSVHEQTDGVYFGVCATGTSSQDSLLSWVRLLEKECPELGSCSIVFTLKSAGKEVAVMGGGSVDSEESREKGKIEDR